MRWTFGLFNRLVLLSDLIVCGTVLLVASHLDRALPAGGQTAPEIALLLLDSIVFVGCMIFAGAYRFENYRKLLNEAVRFAVCLAAGFAVVAGLEVLFGGSEAHPPRALAAWHVAAWAVLSLGRLVVGRAAGHLIATNRLRRDIVIVGSTEIAGQIIRNTQTPEWRHYYRVVAVFDDRVNRLHKEQRDEIEGTGITGSIDALHTYIQDRHVDIIIIALPWEATERIFGLLERLQMIAADIVLPLKQNVLNLRLPHGGNVAGIPVLELMREPLKGTKALLKLVEDYAVAAVGIVLVAPVLAVAALAIKLESPGPALFRQPRLGLNNKPFMIYKLRTMTVDPADDGSRGTQREDPRITRVGAFLRRTSIDELPQLINVLRGEMSVVGPRAHVPKMLVSDQLYAEAVRRYATRSRLKPGITGWAQINGMRGGIHSVEKAARGVELDTYYIENWSLWFDLKIMARTLLVGMVGRNIF